MALITTAANTAAKKDSFSPQSTFIELVEYDPRQQSMDITFKSGTKTRYQQVSAATFLAFKQSPTHSAYYARAIKGNLISSTLIDSSIGRNQSTPLKKVRKENTLDAGVRKQESRTAGTVNRATAAV